MGRGNPGASTSLAAPEPQDDSRERKKEGRVGGRLKERYCLSLCSHEEKKERILDRKTLGPAFGFRTVWR